MESVRRSWEEVAVAAREEVDEFPNVALTANVLVIKWDDGKKPYVLLEHRLLGPYAGLWAPPGGHIQSSESSLEAAQRELWEETGIKVALKDLHFHGRVVSLDGAIVADGYIHERPAHELDLLEPALTEENQEHTLAWVSVEEVHALPLAPGVREVLDRTFRPDHLVRGIGTILLEHMPSNN